MATKITGSTARPDSHDDFPSRPGSVPRYNSSSSFYRNGSYASTAVSSSSEASSSYLDMPPAMQSLHSGERGRGGSDVPPAGSFDDAYKSLDEAFSTNNSSVSSIPRKDSYAESGFSFSSDHGGESGRAGTARTGRVIRVKDSGVSFRFPLDERHLPSVHPTPEQYAAIKKRALALAEQSMKSSYLWLENPTASPQLKKEKWKVHLEKKNCKIYRQRGTDTKFTQNRNTITRAKLYSTLDEIAYAVHCDNTEEQRAHIAIDMVMFEVSKTFRDSTGQKVLARVCQSVSLKDLEGSEPNFGFVRAQISWVNLFRWTGSGSSTVDVVQSSAIQYPANAAPTWLGDRIVTGLHSVVSNLATAGDAKYADKNRLITSKAWVRNSERSACSVCFKSFSLLRSRHHCRICAEIMCSTCTMELTIRLSELPASLRPQDTGANPITSSEKFCLSCINLHRAERRNQLRAVQARRPVRSVTNEGYEVRGGSEPQSDLSPQHHRSVSDADSIPYQNRSSETSYASDSSDGSTVDKHTATNGYLRSARVNLNPPGSRSVDLDESARIANLDGLTQQSARLRVRSNPQQLNSFVRRRQDSNSSNGSRTESISTPSSTTSHSARRGPQWEKLGNADDMLLPEEEGNEDVESIRAIPTTFVKMEEAIAAQQALLRNMMLEGHKIMRSKAQHPPPPPPRKDYLALQ
ncbi:hypothetical protein PybrP1_006032 [[Pythium] brassicae (nom. inval.)]|nr:hypothetical protein PybrP1_006032 [[Pythium] brassicae (nom. inval.)]